MNSSMTSSLLVSDPTERKAGDRHEGNHLTRLLDAPITTPDKICHMQSHWE